MQTSGRRKIVFVCASSAAFLGHHLPLARETARSMEAHAILAMDRPEDADAVRSGGIVPHPLRLGRRSVNPFRVAREAAALRRALRRIAPDLVVPINLKSVLVAAMARMGMDCGLAGVVTGLGYLFTGDSRGKRALRNLTARGLALTLSRKRHVLVFSNDDDRREFVARGVTTDDSAETIPVPGVDPEEFAFLPEPATGFRVALPARMLWDKGVGEFVAAAAALRTAIPEAEFILAGDADPGNPSDIGGRRLEAWVRDGVVAWQGHCDDMPGLLASCHAVCLPSRYREGFPRVLAEAMACGRAIVTTDMPGCRDAVLRSDAGLLVPPSDPEALAVALRFLHAHPQERRRMGARGREWVARELSTNAITARMLAVFDALLAEPGVG